MSGEEISAAMNGLPDAAAHQSDRIDQRSSTPLLGDLLVTFERHRHNKGRTVRVFWVAVRAEQLSPELDARCSRPLALSGLR